ncbi:alpha/beta hydrolase [Elizabethkingia meningoseptica]|uniref:alpha/beta hydrolase n=1 Tax=Elizabethkingia meningoseptica TaxID=238 RepID=UPI0023AEB9CA|nr:alpha/beta hydrolase-fold protein [Elizabethkingia meningoseptica]MDE5436732.1 alpha/beta hydrolase [Elizabethkingia meningoseptica]MDE5508069.1 alpha/beta hydrolase [Elizabethkingia meningoseptica]MDE5514759.1 alpha/beta hydrolase [Elizabethkingia meningoseptica]MDE5525445.1 alpha/beta hydrolase [Elizabethkingia meningoseptica]MDE5529024.1 alpha/beta hydrolase [Elizabethkingia meningoseptica]
MRYTLFLLVLFLCPGLQAQQDIRIGKKYNLKSKALNEERAYWIALPEGYEKYSRTKYPVVYLLDAENNFNYFTRVYSYLSREPFGMIPQAIIVGITNTDRTRDLTPTRSGKEVSFAGKNQVLFQNSGGNAQFLKFLKDELLPEVDKKYRTNGYTVLVGHSFGGLTAVNSMLTDPFFSAYVAHDPSLWWDHQIMNKKAEGITGDYGKTTFFITQANNGETQMAKDGEQGGAIIRFKELLEKNNLKNLRWDYQFYTHDNHGTVALPGNIDGLRFIFKPYVWDVRSAIKNPGQIMKHYEEASKELQHKFIPTEQFFDKMTEITKERGTQAVRDSISILKSKYYPQ